MGPDLIVIRRMKFVEGLQSHVAFPKVGTVLLSKHTMETVNEFGKVCKPVD